MSGPTSGDCDVGTFKYSIRFINIGLFDDEVGFCPVGGVSILRAKGTQQVPPLSQVLTFGSSRGIISKPNLAGFITVVVELSDEWCDCQSIHCHPQGIPLSGSFT